MFQNSLISNIGVAAVDTGFIKSILPRIQCDGAKTVDNESLSWPTAVVWLMVSAVVIATSRLFPGRFCQQPYRPKQSFPNSGTSYTLHTVRKLTNTTTASNYGLEGTIKDEESVPVFTRETVA